jgi:hypothetical protein
MTKVWYSEAKLRTMLTLSTRAAEKVNVPPTPVVLNHVVSPLFGGSIA